MGVERKGILHLRVVLVLFLATQAVEFGEAARRKRKHEQGPRTILHHKEPRHTEEILSQDSSASPSYSHLSGNTLIGATVLKAEEVLPPSVSVLSSFLALRRARADPHPTIEPPREVALPPAKSPDAPIGPQAWREQQENNATRVKTLKHAKKKASQGDQKKNVLEEKGKKKEDGGDDDDDDDDEEKSKQIHPFWQQEEGKEEEGTAPQKGSASEKGAALGKGSASGKSAASDEAAPKEKASVSSSGEKDVDPPVSFWKGWLPYIITGVICVLLLGALVYIFSRSRRRKSAREWIASHPSTSVAAVMEGTWVKVAGRVIPGGESPMLSSPLRGRQCCHFQAKAFCDGIQVAHHQDSADFYVQDETGQAILIHAADVETLDDLQNLTELGPYNAKSMPQECQRFLMNYRNGQLDPSVVSQLQSQAVPLTFEEVVLEPEARICALGVVCRNPQTGALSLQSDTAFHLVPGLNPSAQKEAHVIRRDLQASLEKEEWQRVAAHVVVSGDPELAPSIHNFES